MSWERELFAVLDDLESQAEALWESEREAELADRARSEYASVGLATRVMASRGQDVQVDLPHVGRVEGRVDRVGPDWFLLSGRGQDWVVALSQVVAIAGASARSVPDAAWSPVDRLGLRSALRRLADSGERCLVHLVDGSRHEAVLRRVGEDFVECLVGAGHDLLVPFAALVAVQSREG